jgi:hypothetical protein
VLHHKTQTDKYWVEDFQLEQSDIDHLYNVLLEIETPLSTDQMALILVRHRVRIEAEKREAQISPGDTYLPRKEYKSGDIITLPQFSDVQGTVKEVRPGENPDDASFSVISVELDSGEVVELASQYEVEHPLNVDPIVEEQVEDSHLVSEEIFIEYGGYVAERLEETFSDHDDLVRLAGRWFPKSLLAEVNVGHLNLAEAVLDMYGGGALTTPEILEQIGMMDDVNQRLAEFSMNYALQEDARFDEVGAAGQVLWYLHRMEPDEVRNVPEWLEYDPLPEAPDLLTDEMKEMEQEIGDELSDIPVQRGPVPQSVTITLTYPHRRAGTLPLSHQLRRMFPTAYRAPRIRFTIVDGDTGEEIPAWVVMSGGYVYGLKKWFETHDVPAGGYLTIERTDVAGTVMVKYAGRSPRKEWVLTAFIENSRLHFENRQRTVSCEYDELMMIDVADDEAVDKLWAQVRSRKISFEELVSSITRELAALNPQGNVHAKTLYSAVNVALRCPPGPIFSLLVAHPQFEQVGGPYWQLSKNGTE